MMRSTFRWPGPLVSALLLCACSHAVRTNVDYQGNVVDSRIVSEQPQPFSLDYDFSFDLRDGKPVVASNRTH